MIRITLSCCLQLPGFLVQFNQLDHDLMIHDHDADLYGYYYSCSVGPCLMHGPLDLIMCQFGKKGA